MLTLDGGAQWFQMSKTRQKISSPELISWVFQCKILHIHITSVSGCLSLTFKICQTVAGKSMIPQFHKFFKSHFWRDFAIRLNCGAGPAINRFLFLLPTHPSSFFVSFLISATYFFKRSFSYSLFFKMIFFDHCTLSVCIIKMLLSWKAKSQHL